MIISQMKLLLIKKKAIDIEVKGQGHYVIFITVQRSEILCILCLVNSFRIIITLFQEVFQLNLR